MLKGTERTHEKTALKRFQSARDEYKKLVKALARDDCKKALEHFRRSILHLGISGGSNRYIIRKGWVITDDILSLHAQLMKAEEKIINCFKRKCK